MTTTEVGKTFGSAEELATKGPLPDALLFYPEGQQYPFDPTCREIVDQLQRLHWQAPGIKVDFWMSQGDSPRPIAVHGIEGTNFKLSFAFRGFQKASETESANKNIGTIDIPKRHLEIFDDFSGPTYSIYRGLSWERDRKSFRQQTGNYFAYTGSDYTDRDAHAPGKLAAYLIPNRYANHEKPRMPWEPASLKTAEVMGEFNTWLSMNVLDQLKKVGPPIAAS